MILSNDVVWNKTQRLGGQAFFFGGILMLIAIFAAGQDILKWIVIAITVFICLVPTVMSYVWYQQEMRKSEE